MNKKKLFNTILITLLIFVGLTWIIKTGSYTEGTYTEGSLEPLGIFDIFYIPLQAFQTYVQYGLYLLVVGGFYGILKKTGTYKTLIEKMGKMNEIYIDKSNELKTLCSQYAALKKKLASKMSNLQQKKEKYLRVKNENFVIKTMVLKIVQNDNLEVNNNK